VSSTADAGAAKPSRKSHRCVLRGADVLHKRFGVTDPEVLRILSQTALGVEDIKAPPARFTSLAYVQQASARTPVRHEAMPHAAPLPGESCSLDFTRTFVRDMDGHTCAAIMLDLSTYSLWVSSR
jgi:hypothetical protein